MKHQTTILTLSILLLIGFTIYQQRLLIQHLTRIATLEHDLQLAEEVLIQTRQDLQNLEYTINHNHQLSWQNWMRIRTLFYDYYHIQLESDKEP